jgi:hypothetical protein
MRSRSAKPEPNKGCNVGSAVGCYGKAGVKSVVDVVFDGLIGPLPSYQRADDLVLYIVQPDCGYFSNCDDGDEGSSWSWGSVFETVVDFTPIIGDLKGIYEAVKDPTAVNIVSAGIGLAGPWGDAFAKSIKAAAKAKKALKVDVPNAAPDITKPYKRPSGATTQAQRDSVQGQPCVKCGDVPDRNVAGHKKALVEEYYETGTIDQQRMRSLDAVRPECPTCSAREGAEMSRYSRQKKDELGL